MRPRYLPPLFDNKTQSYRDMINIIAHLIQHMGNKIVLVAIGDGQSVRLLGPTTRHLDGQTPPHPLGSTRGARHPGTLGWWLLGGGTMSSGEQA